MKKLLSLILTIVLIFSIIPLGTFAVSAATVTSGTTGVCTWSLDGTVLTISGNGYMGDYYYKNAPWGTKITEIIIEDGVTNIGYNAFYECYSLTSITIPDSVTRIGYNAFRNCTSLTSIIIPNSVTSIGYGAFYNCTSLTSVTIPDSVTSIGDSAFSGCEKLQNIEVDDGNKYFSDIDGVLFNKDKNTILCYPAGKTSTSYIIPNSVRSIGDRAFNQCTSLTSITIPDSVTSIGYSAFARCDSLTSIIIPDSVTSIVEGAFSGCDSLTSITIPDSVTSIGYNAFCDCISLTSITIPDSVTYIGVNPFENCTSLKIVNYNATNCTMMGFDENTGECCPVFYGCSKLATINIGSKVKSIPAYAFEGCTSLTNIQVLVNNSNYTSVDGVLFNKDKTTLICYPAGKTAKTYTIPDSVTSIGDSSFYDCESLTSITIPNSVISIGGWAFYNCTSLTSITIPDSVTQIGECAFYDCDELTTMNYNAVNCTKMGEVTYNVFRDCTKLTTVNIGSKVKTIPAYAFAYCYSLTSVIIPDSVTSISDSAFKGCNATLVCNPNTYAEKFAKENNINFTYYVSNVKITKQPTKTQYYVGDKIDLSGLEVTVYYYDGTSEVVSDYTVSECDDSAGRKEIVISCRGFNESFFVDFAPIEMSGIVITSLPNNLLQNNEETLDLSGLVVAAKYNNGDSKVITDYTVTGYNSLVGAIQTITVAYAGFTTSFEIEILCVNPVGTCGEDISWNFYVNTGKLIINGTGNMFDYKLSGDDNAPWLTYSNQIKSIEISNGITHIGSNAFVGCSGVKSLNIPDSVESIGDFAFNSCGGLLELTIGDGIKTIGKDAFNNCTRLKKVYISDLANWCGIVFASNANPLVNNAALYLDGSVITDLIIPNGVTNISENAFVGCITIKNVVIPEGVNSIGKDAFMKCASLSSVSLPSTLKTINDSAFRLCEKIKDVYITDLSGWLNIKFATYDANPLCVAENLYLNGKLLRELVIPEGTTEIAPMAFYNFQGFDYIYLPSSIAFVGEDAFNFCGFDTVEFASGTELVLKEMLPDFRSTNGHIIIPEDVIFIESDSITGSSTQIFGKEGSEAEVYALDNEIQFYKTPVSIEIAQLPDRTIYYKESKNALDYSFSTKGLKIKATYYDGTSDVLESGFKILNRDYPYIEEMTTGVHSIDVWFGGKTTNFDIKVYSKEIKSLSVTESPIKTAYALGEHFEPQGMVVTAYYKDGTSEHIDINEDMISGFDSSTVGKKTVTVAFGEKTTSFNVMVYYHREKEHVYDNACDKTCDCGYVRTVGAHKYNSGKITTKPTCTKTGLKTYTCTECGKKKTETLAKLAHKYTTTTTKATLSKNGKVVKKCKVCGKVASTTTIKYAKSFKLSTTSYTYNGKVKTPGVIIKDSAGKTLKKNTDYTVSYASGRKNVGTYKVTVKMKGNYTGTKTLTFKINPASTKVSKLTAGKKSITVNISKKSTQVSGYQVQYSTSKSFKKTTTKTISSYKTTKTTLKSLSAKKTYYVRVRTYKTVSGKKYYSGWSTYKYVKTK